MELALNTEKHRFHIRSPSHGVTGRENSGNDRARIARLARVYYSEATSSHGGTTHSRLKGNLYFPPNKIQRKSSVKAVLNVLSGDSQLQFRADSESEML